VAPHVKREGAGAPPEKGALRVDQSELLAKGFSFSGYERDPLYLNLGDRRYLDISGVSGIDHIGDGRGAVFADFDNDGDLDVFLTTIQREAHLLFRNNVGQARNHVRVAVEGGPRSGRDAFGTVVRLRTSKGVLTKIKAGGAGYLSQHDPRILFGLDEDAQVEAIEVVWPDGGRQRFAGPVKAGESVLLREGADAIATERLRAARLPDPLSRAEGFARGLKLRVGDAVPDVPLRTGGGEGTSLRRLLRPGRRLLLNVWATWCAPCAREMPELEALRPALEAQGLDLVGLNVDTEPDADPVGFAKARPIRYPIYLGGVAAAEALYATDELTVPLSLVLDDEGRLRQLIPGWSAESRRRFLTLAGKPPTER
jgi:thiol-disulfide isomerase/thioredoxin